MDNVRFEYKYVINRDMIGPDDNTKRRYPHTVIMSFIDNDKGKDPRKSWLYDTWPGSRWVTYLVRQYQLSDSNPSLVVGMPKTMREYRFQSEQDLLMFQLRWVEAQVDN